MSRELYFYSADHITISEEEAHEEIFSPRSELQIRIEQNNNKKPKEPLVSYTKVHVPIPTITLLSISSSPNPAAYSELKIGMRCLIKDIF